MSGPYEIRVSELAEVKNIKSLEVSLKIMVL
jgi:hypothetical protein